MWLWWYSVDTSEHSATQKAQNSWFFTSLTVPDSFAEAGCYPSELLMAPLQVLSHQATQKGPMPTDTQSLCHPCSLCCHPTQQLGTTARCTTKPMNFSTKQWDELHLFSKDLNLFQVCAFLVHSPGPRVLHKFPHTSPLLCCHNLITFYIKLWCLTSYGFHLLSPDWTDGSNSTKNWYQINLWFIFSNTCKLKLTIN